MAWEASRVAGVHADDHRDRKRLAAGLRRIVEPMQITREHEDAEPIGSAHLQAVDRHVLVAGLRVGRDDEARGDVRAAVVLVVDGNGEIAGEVDLADHFLLHGRPVRFPARQRRFDGPLVAIEQAGFVRAERLGNPGARGYEPGDDGDRVAPVRLGKERRPAAVQALRHRGEGESERYAGPGAGEPPGLLQPVQPIAEGRRRGVAHDGVTHR